MHPPLRKTKTVGGTTHSYHNDGTNLIRITNASGTTFYYVTNYRGDVIRIMDASGNSVASYSYDPWGKALSVSENAAVAGQPLRYASYVYDTETQLYYLQARYYDPETARFISRDPDGGDQTNPLSQNLYAYGNDDPVNNVDPDEEYAWAASLFFVPGVGQVLAGAVLVTAAIAATIYLGYIIYETYYPATNHKDNTKTCKACGLQRIMLPEAQAYYYSAEVREQAMDFNYSAELFGTGCYPRPRLIVSQKIRCILLEQKVKGIHYDPIFYTT